jgi:ComF family protein
VGDQSNHREHSAGWLAEVGDALVSVFFPADCRTCDQLLTRASRVPICDDCLASFLPLLGKLCEICGRPITSGAENRSPTGIEVPRCALCRVRPGQEESLYGFDFARSYASYDGVLVRAILLLKFERMEPLGQWFAERLTELVRREALAADVVVPVPLHRQRERERGYNQAELIARPLARRLKLPHGSVLLMRTRPRPDKHLLSLEERWESVRGAFATRAGSVVDNLRVLLVDDVMTTGATLDACARVLRRAGAKSVIALTVARALRNPIRDPREP